MDGAKQGPSGGGGDGGGAAQIRLEDLPKLEMDQLRQVKASVDQELEVLQESLANLRRALQRLQASKDAVDSFSKRKEGQEVLVPLTGSLYVPGKLRSLDKLIVDIGATYYAERSIPDTKDYCDRRMKMVKENLEKVVEVLAQKEQIAEKVMGTMQAKMRALMAAK